MARALIEAGRLKERVTVMHRIGTQDPIYGGYTYTWEPLATIWAEVQDILPSRSESIADSISIVRRPARVRMRYRDDLDSSMRLVVNGRTLNIIAGPAELGFRAGLEFMAEELSTQGEEP